MCVMDVHVHVHDDDGDGDDPQRPKGITETKGAEEVE